MMKPVQSAEIYFNQNNTPVSSQFDDVYFCNQDGLAESDYVFQQGNQLWQRWQKHQQNHFVIAETGFGTGLNFLAITTLFRRFRATFPQATLTRLFFISFEKYPLPRHQLMLAQQAYPEFSSLCQQLQQQWQTPIEGCYRHHFAETTLDLWIGDVLESLPQLGDYMRGKIDAWLLDGFAPSKNPDMWQPALYDFMYQLTKEQGTFATFTAASAVRKGLEAAGFIVQKRKGYGKKRECLQGYKPTIEIKNAQTPWYLPQAAKFTQPADVAIIGGGIASAFCALALQQRGAKVSLYCADDELAQNASGNKQGAFYPQLSDDDERNIRFYLQAFSYGLTRLQELIAQGIEFEQDFCGVALCAYDNKAATKLAKIAELPLPTSLFQSLNAEQLSQILGLPVAHSGGFIPQGGWLAPQQLVQNLFKFLQQQGVKIYTSQQIIHLEQHSEGWLLQNEKGKFFSHKILILGNGHQLNQFEQTKNLPIYSVRGQVSHIPTTSNLKKLKTVLCYDGYLTPASQQQFHCLGASHIRDCDERQFSLAEQQENQLKIQRNLAMEWTKEIDTSGNQAKVGIRCAVRDRSPLLGNVPHFQQQQQDYQNLFNLRRRKQSIANAAWYENLFLIGALGSRGLTSAPLLAETLASLIYNEPLPLSEDILHNISPNRNWIRRWLKGAKVESKMK